VLINRWLHPQRGFDKWWERRHLPRPYEPLARYEGQYVSDWDNPSLADENLKNEKSHLSVDLYPRSERMQYGLDLTKKLLSRTRELADEYKSTFIIFATLKPNEQKMLKDTGTDDVIVHKRNDVFYRTSFRQTMANLDYANAGFTFFTVPILLDKWQASDTDTHHLSCMANEQVMRDLAAKVAAHLPLEKSAR